MRFCNIILSNFAIFITSSALYANGIPHEDWSGNLCMISRSEKGFIGDLCLYCGFGSKLFLLGAARILLISVERLWNLSTRSSTRFTRIYLSGILVISIALSSAE